MTENKGYWIGYFAYCVRIFGFGIPLYLVAIM